MKKIICIALAVLLLASLTAPAFALTTDGEITEDGVLAAASGPAKLEGCLFTIDTETGRCQKAEGVRIE